MNLYRGCLHNCSYCDGRAERYQVDDCFGTNVSVKINAIDRLRKEFVPPRSRPPLRSGFIMVGGGVGDSYQPAEETYQLTRKTLQLLHTVRYPVHILTKSTLALRDLDLIKKINTQTRAVVSVSLSSVDDQISSIFEPQIPPPSARLRMLSTFKQHNVPCGIYLLPVIPLLTDTKEHVTAVFEQARKIGVDFIIFGGMTLKAGRQQHHFYQILSKHYPQLLPSYKRLYPGDTWGNARRDYYQKLNRLLLHVQQRHPLPVRMPPRLWGDLVTDVDRLIVILEHLDYLHRLHGIKTSFAKAAAQLSKIKQPLKSQQPLKEMIRTFPASIQALCEEIQQTKTAQRYEHLLFSST